MSETKPEGSSRIEASVWRVGADGALIISVSERHASALAEKDSDSIYFYGELESSTELTHTEETMSKVFDGLASVGLSEKQIINAVSKMQNAGIYFREAI